MSLADDGDAALDWVQSNGWPSHEIDTAFAHRIYTDWLEGIRKERQDLCSADRWVLLERIFREMTDRYGQTRGKNYAVLLMIDLELSAREEGMPYRAITH